MKTLLIIDANLGQARAYMAKTLLGAAAHKANLDIIDNPNDAELAIVLADAIPNDNALNGKKVWLGDIARAVAHLSCFLAKPRGTRSLTAHRLLLRLLPQPAVRNVSWP